MQFGRAFPRILQEIWEVDLDKGPDRVSNLDVTDTYHRGTLRTFHVGDFDYTIPLADKNNCIIICIDIVLLMGWVDARKFSARSHKH